jgi:5-methylcytosine-specific restriction endonuclease McrA
MKILPPSTQPWSEVLVRRHQPLRNFRAERRRQCLRWEFGFTCAFCLTHESDLAFCGAEGTGLTAIEHFVPRSVDPGRLHDYSNLFYICYSCNRARGRQPVEEKLGRRLLNPCEAVWAAHFERVGNRLEPLDENARYTEKLYKLNSGAKMQIRAARDRSSRQGLSISKSSEGRHYPYWSRADFQIPCSSGTAPIPYRA